MDPFSLVLLLLLVPLVLLSVRGSRQRKAVAQMQSELATGTEVMTASGQFGTVTGVRDDRVEIEVAPGVRTWWLRQAIARRVDPAAPVASDDDLVADDVVEDDPRDDPSDGSRRPA